MLDPVGVSEGLAVVHLFCARGDDSAPAAAPLFRASARRSLDEERSRGKDDTDDAVVAAVEMAEADGVQVVTVAVLGHKAQLCFMALADDAWKLRRLQTGLEAAGLMVVDSFVSITEVSEYAEGLPEDMKAMRLYPELPPEGKHAWCFYPMTKRRGPEYNWYRLDFEQRRDLMHEHGASGRKFAGRIVQLITASTGLDDWEWGVTLFGARLDDLKDTVYTMRYDTASALYAEFGPFYTGLVGPVREILARA